MWLSWWLDKKGGELSWKTTRAVLTTIHLFINHTYRKRLLTWLFIYHKKHCLRPEWNSRNKLSQCRQFIKSDGKVIIHFARGFKNVTGFVWNKKYNFQTMWTYMVILETSPTVYFNSSVLKYRFHGLLLTKWS